MSGGSYNYLCYKEGEDMFSYQCRSDLEDMANDLAALPYAADVANDTKALLLEINTALDKISALKERLDPIFRAQEWLVSSDGSEENLLDEIKAYMDKRQNESKVKQASLEQLRSLGWDIRPYPSVLASLGTAGVEDMRRFINPLFPVQFGDNIYSVPPELYSALP